MLRLPPQLDPFGIFVPFLAMMLFLSPAANAFVRKRYGRAAILFACYVTLWLLSFGVSGVAFLSIVCISAIYVAFSRLSVCATQKIE
jgi:hypothetical protein